jgi:hypothetical protein
VKRVLSRIQWLQFFLGHMDLLRVLGEAGVHFSEAQTFVEKWNAIDEAGDAIAPVLDELSDGPIATPNKTDRELVEAVASSVRSHIVEEARAQFAYSRSADDKELEPAAKAALDAQVEQEVSRATEYASHYNVDTINAAVNIASIVNRLLS